MDDSTRNAALELIDGGVSDRARIVDVLEKFGLAALTFASQHGIRIVPLLPGDSYKQRSPALQRLGVDVDTWPAPPAGLFVVEERTVYLRSRSAMTVAHEFGHALDCALGGGVYLSSTDPRLKQLFADAKAFVTPYAATGADEYFAESMRAFVEVNDHASFWPRATRARLRRTDPRMYAYVERLFETGFGDGEAICHGAAVCHGEESRSARMRGVSAEPWTCGADNHPEVSRGVFAINCPFDSSGSFDTSG